MLFSKHGDGAGDNSDDREDRRLNGDNDGGILIPACRYSVESEGDESGDEDGEIYVPSRLSSDRHSVIN
ncbi:predicted protein [Arabidopsis lyrata subsp. lyrata]|uniref:Predicted protein n=1 Tax=Arabidopsis lyrata subsp. lyrata TaxID=81972 RepID=D7MLZ6_ARALL|nr:predicted protein [Arabidopsis lyrata subsp. lyrata]EFH39823.1 predicted protein [Arabidopsis lyrata subsp. lyrata]